MEHLHGDVAIQDGVMGEEDHAHSAGPDAAKELVAASEHAGHRPVSPADRGRREGAR